MLRLVSSWCARSAFTSQLAPIRYRMINVVAAMFGGVSDLPMHLEAELTWQSQGLTCAASLLGRFRIEGGRWLSCDHEPRSRIKLPIT